MIKRQKGQRARDWPEETSELLFCDHGMVNVGKEAQGPEGPFTKVDLMGQSRSEVDFLFLLSRWKIEKAETTLVFLFDHCLLLVKTEMGGKTKLGKGMWKLNVNLVLRQKIHRYLMQLQDALWKTSLGITMLKL